MYHSSLRRGKGIGHESIVKIDGRGAGVYWECDHFYAPAMPYMLWNTCWYVHKRKRKWHDDGVGVQLASGWGGYSLNPNVRAAATYPRIPRWLEPPLTKNMFTCSTLWYDSRNLARNKPPLRKKNTKSLNQTSTFYINHFVSMRLFSRPFYFACFLLFFLHI